MTTIRVTEENNKVIKIIDELDYFKLEGDIGQFAFAYALRNHLDEKYPDYQFKSTTTKWGVDDLDKDGLMSSIVSAKYPDEDVSRKMQYIINLGLMEIGKRITGLDRISITSLME